MTRDAEVGDGGHEPTHTKAGLTGRFRFVWSCPHGITTPPPPQPTRKVARRRVAEDGEKGIDSRVNRAVKPGLWRIQNYLNRLNPTLPKT